MCNFSCRFSFHISDNRSIIDFGIFIHLSLLLTFLTAGIRLKGQSNPTLTETRLPIPYLTNLKALHQAYILENEEEIHKDPLYVYRNPTNNATAFLDTFYRAYPFESCGLAKVKFQNDSVFCVINTKGEIVYRASPKEEINNIFFNGSIQLERTVYNQNEEQKNTYSIWLNGKTVVSDLKERITPIAGTDLYTNFNRYSENQTVDQSLLINQEGKIIAKNLKGMQKNRSGELFLFNAVSPNKKKSAIEIYNQYGKRIYTTKPISINYDWDEITSQLVINEDPDNLVHYCLFIPDSKTHKDNQFVVISKEGTILFETKGIDDFYFREDWVFIKKYDEDGGGKSWVFHPKKGLIKKIHDLSIDRYNQKKPFLMIYTAKGNTILVTDQESYPLHLPKFKTCEINAARIGVKITLSNHSKNSEPQKFFFDYGTKKLIPIGEWVFSNEGSSFIIKSIDGKKIICTSRNNYVEFTSENLDINIPNTRLYFVNNSMFGITLRDSVYFFNFKGERANPAVEEGNLYEIQPEYFEMAPYAALLYDTDTSKKIVGYPDLDLLKIKDVLLPSGNVLTMDIKNHIRLLSTTAATTNRLVTRPSLIAIDTNFVDYQCYQPFMNESFDFDLSNIKHDNFKKNIDIIYNNRLRRFWVYHQNNLLLHSNFNGDFVEDCMVKFPSDNYSYLPIWEKSTFPLLFKNNHKIFAIAADEYGNPNIDSFLLSTSTDAPIKQIILNRNILKVREQSKIFYPYSSILEYIFDEPNEQYHSFLLKSDSLAWVTFENSTMGLWNIFNQRWIIDPSERNIINVYGDEMVYLITTKDSQFHTLMNFDGVPIIKVPNTAGISIFSEGEEMGTFINIKQQNITTTYRMNRAYELKSNFPNLKDLPKSIRQSIKQNSDNHSNYNLNKSLFQLDIYWNNEFPVYYDSSGKLLVDI